MERNIELLIKTPFDSFIKKSVVFNDENKNVYIPDDNDLNGKVIVLDVSTTIREDIESITEDVNKRKLDDPERYGDYDTHDIVLEKIKIMGDTAVCNYTINAGDYRRICVGITSNVYKDNNKHYFTFPPMYNGKVCW